jgi:hypothetical protein
MESMGRAAAAERSQRLTEIYRQQDGLAVVIDERDGAASAYSRRRYRSTRYSSSLICSVFFGPRNRESSSRWTVATWRTLQLGSCSIC